MVSIVSETTDTLFLSFTTTFLSEHMRLYRAHFIFWVTSEYYLQHLYALRFAAGSYMSIFEIRLIVHTESYVLA